MDREIKFSAYDKYKERWIYAENAYELYNLFYGFSDDGYSDGQLKWLRQYTGIDTIDSREVYEGDIIENEYWELLLVEYEGPSARWVGSNNKGWVALDDLLEAKGEIVGNKFQNPELLGLKEEKYL